jgi:hypothetical protein
VQPKRRKRQPERPREEVKDELSKAESAADSLDIEDLIHNFKKNVNNKSES